LGISVLTLGAFSIPCGGFFNHGAPYQVAKQTHPLSLHEERVVLGEVKVSCVMSSQSMYFADLLYIDIEMQDNRSTDR